MNLSLMAGVEPGNSSPAMFLRRAAFALSVLPFAGCLSVKTQPIEVKPIHITVDVNVQVKVEKALQNFFGDIDRKAAETGT